MKQMTCELCGSTDLVKQDGMFVCQSCGCKYTVEEARKLMGGDGDAPVAAAAPAGSTTVKVDMSEKLTKLYQIARRARDDNNSENAAKYYDLILQEDPMSWEASFYTVYYQAMQTNIAGIENAAYKVRNCLGSVMGLIRDYVPEEDQASAVGQVATSVGSICQMLSNAAKSHYDGISSNIKSQYTQEYLDNVAAARDTLYTLGDLIEKTFTSQEVLEFAPLVWKMGIALHETILPRLANQAGNNRIIDGYVQKIGKYDPSYQNERKAESLKKEIADLDRQISGFRAASDIKFSTKGIRWFVLAFLILVFPSQVLGIGMGPFFTPFMNLLLGTALLIGGLIDLKKKITLGILWIVGGLFAGMFGYNMLTLVSANHLVFPMIPYSGYLCIALYIGRGIALGLQNRPTKAQLEANAKKVEELEAKKAKLDQELSELTVQ